MARNKHDPREVREAAIGYGETEVSASALKNAWHQWLQRVAEGGQTLIVTRYGKPIARLSPAGAEARDRRLFGALAGSVTRAEDLVSPAGEPWDAEG
jgi:antitoxin (DNA-binding transcriptional repressor) of toxin-antitoxin stability system